MKKIIKVVLLLLQLLVCYVYALHGKIVFYDGTYVVGKVTKVDESAVYIVPIGLDTAEGVLTGNIDSLKMENGMVPVVNSAVKYFYQNGEFLANENDWMDEYGDFQYDDYTMLQDEYKYESTKKTNQQYYQVSAFGGIPVSAAVSLQEENGTFKMEPNLGVSIQLPYKPYGALDISPGLRIMMFTYEASHQGKIQALQLGAGASFDFKPVLYFLPPALHASVDFALNYNTAYDLDQNIINYPNVEAEALVGTPTYSGLGMNLGLSIDYWIESLPIAFKIFGQGNIVPQAPPFTDTFTMFNNVGISMILVLKRHSDNNSESE